MRSSVIRFFRRQLEISIYGELPPDGQSGDLKLDKSGRVALVTVARQSLGLAFARALAKERAIVVAVDRDDAPEVVDDLRRLSNAPAMFLQVDVTSPQQVDEAAKHILGEFGKCDIIVNNAGINHQTPFMEIVRKDWRQIMTAGSADDRCHAARFMVINAYFRGLTARRSSVRATYLSPKIWLI